MNMGRERVTENDDRKENEETGGEQCKQHMWGRGVG